MDLLEEGKINEKEALLRIDPNKLDELLHPVFDPKALEDADIIAQGLARFTGSRHGPDRLFCR